MVLLSGSHKHTM